jgi:uncharacterized protein (TIGR02145 family)
MKKIVRIPGVILLIFLILMILSCKKKETLLPPALITTVVTEISFTTATSGGDLTDIGGAYVTARGVCWNTSVEPTIENSKTTESGGLGTFTSNLTELAPNTVYYVRAYGTNVAGTGYGNEVSFTTSQVAVAVLTTTAITSITQTTAVSGGNITADGGGSVTARGVCWSTATGPTTADSKTTNGTGTGEFTSAITDLTGGTTYNVRAYATNSVGTAYGNEISFTTSSAVTTVTDIDGNIYNAVTIGTQTWMAENLKTTKYQNGDLIGTTTPASLNIQSENTPKYQWAQDGNESNVATYGRLYTWYAITDSRNVCPTGWHISTDAEWTTLTNYLENNGYGYEGSGSDIAKSIAATSGWDTYSYSLAGTIGDDQASNNSSGFTALPGGIRDNFGSFLGMGYESHWWSSTEVNTNDAWCWFVYNDDKYVERLDIYKIGGFSVRCLKDN